MPVVNVMTPNQDIAAPRCARYNRGVRSLIFAIIVLGCGSPPAVQRPKGSGSGSGSGSVATTNTGAKLPATGPTVVRDIGCIKPSCAFHAGGAAYFTCQSGGAGTCFHFGATCTPQNGCMYDPATKSYKLCTKPVEGTCQAWGGACAPTSKCMFDATDNMHRTCDALDGGSCKKFGALCSP